MDRTAPVLGCLKASVEDKENKKFIVSKARSLDSYNFTSRQNLHFHNFIPLVMLIVVSSFYSCDLF